MNTSRKGASQLHTLRGREDKILLNRPSLATEREGVPCRSERKLSEIRRLSVTRATPLNVRDEIRPRCPGTGKDSV